MAEKNGNLTGRLDILDYVRALAIIQVFMYHYYIEWFQGIFLLTPNGVEGNLGKLWIFNGDGVLGFFFALIKNFFSWMFIYGFAAVNIFLVLSGFVLTYSLLRSGGLEKIKGWKPWIQFFWKRLKRILIPFYISVVIGIGFLFLRNVLFPAYEAWPLFQWMDLLKLVFVPFVFWDILLLQRFNGDYWYIPLILQLYLVFPILFYLLKKIGTRKFIVIIFGITFAYRLIAMLWLNSVPMGVAYPSEHSYRLYSFFLPRLFEFGFGMALGYLEYTSQIIEKIKGTKVLALGLFLTLSGYALLTYKVGWVISDMTLGVGLFFLFTWISGLFADNGRVSRCMKICRKFLNANGEAAYETYLLHHYFLNYFLMYLLLVLGLRGNETVFWVLMPVYVVSVLIIGYAGRKLSVLTESLLTKLRGR